MNKVKNERVTVNLLFPHPFSHPPNFIQTQRGATSNGGPQTTGPTDLRLIRGPRGTHSFSLMSFHRNTCLTPLFAQRSSSSAVEWNVINYLYALKKRFFAIFFKFLCIKMFSIEHHHSWPFWNNNWKLKKFFYYTINLSFLELNIIL